MSHLKSDSTSITRLETRQAVASATPERVMSTEEAAVRENAEASSFLTGTLSGPTKMDVFTKRDPRSGYPTMCNSLLMEEACSSWSWHFLIGSQNGGRCGPFFDYRNRFSCQGFSCENTHGQTPFCATSQRHADGDVGSARSYGTGCGEVGDVEFKAPTIDFEILWNSDVVAAHTVYTHWEDCFLVIYWLKYQVIRSWMICFLATVHEPSQIRFNFHHTFGNPSGCGICHSWASDVRRGGSSAWERRSIQFPYWDPFRAHKNGCLHKTWPSIWVSNHVQFTFDGRSLLQLIMAFFDRVSEWREVQAFFRLQESVFLSVFFLREHPWTDPFLCHIPTTCRCRCWLGAKLWHRLWGVGDVEFKAPTIDLEILWNSDIAAHTVYTHAYHIISSCIDKIAFLLSSLWNSDWLKYQVMNDMFSSYSTWVISNPIQLSITRLETCQAVASATPERLMSTMSQFSEADLSIWPHKMLSTILIYIPVQQVLEHLFPWFSVAIVDVNSANYMFIYIYTCVELYIVGSTLYMEQRISRMKSLTAEEHLDFENILGSAKLGPKFLKCRIWFP